MNDPREPIAYISGNDPRRVGVNRAMLEYTVGCWGPDEWSDWKLRNGDEDPLVVLDGMYDGEVDAVLAALDEYLDQPEVRDVMVTAAWEAFRDTNGSESGRRMPAALSAALAAARKGEL